MSFIHSFIHSSCVIFYALRPQFNIPCLVAFFVFCFVCLFVYFSLGKTRYQFNYSIFVRRVLHLQKFSSIALQGSFSLRLKGSNLSSLVRSKGSNASLFRGRILQQNRSETESVGERQFAMMAAQGLDVLWIRSSFSLVFFVIAASGTRNGTSNHLLYIIETCYRQKLEVRGFLRLYSRFATRFCWSRNGIDVLCAELYSAAVVVVERKRPRSCPFVLLC